MFRFKVISGNHFDIDNKKYVPGDFIESEVRLDDIFKNKFEFIEKIEKPELEAQVGSKPEEKTEVKIEEKVEKKEEVKVEPQRHRRKRERKPEAF